MPGAGSTGDTHCPLPETGPEPLRNRQINRAIAVGFLAEYGVCNGAWENGGGWVFGKGKGNRPGPVPLMVGATGFELATFSSQS